MICYIFLCISSCKSGTLYSYLPCTALPSVQLLNSCPAGSRTPCLPQRCLLITTFKEVELQCWRRGARLTGWVTLASPDLGAFTEVVYMKSGCTRWNCCIAGRFSVVFLGWAGLDWAGSIPPSSSWSNTSHHVSVSVF